LAVTNLKAQLTSLVQLQTLDTEIYALRNEKEAKPQEIKVLGDAFEQKKQSLAALETKLQDLQRQRKERELELGSKEEATKKLQGQLYQLKTNKEYQAMLQQIDDSKADASLIEDKILESLDAIDKAKTEIEKEKVRLQEEEKAFNAQKKTIEERIKEIDARLAELESKRKQILPVIEKKILAQYERILSSRDALAIVRVINSTCQGCNMFVPPQVINLIKMYERIITCEVCNRMLYIEEDASQ
jgi:predicted  nucleic acid-binding Zn-ribbon protein